MSRVASVLWYAQAMASLARLVNRPRSLQEMRAIVKQRLETREERFLAAAARCIFGHPRSPYLELLRHAGCESGDLALMVRQRGLEPTLEHLRREGVYLSFDEFKGRADVTRNGRTFRFSEHDFDNPFLGAGLQMRTGGTRSRGSPVSVGLRFVEEHMSLGVHLSLAALGAVGLPTVLWTAGLAASGGYLGWVHTGHPPVRWFTMHDPNEPSVPARNRIVHRMARVLALWRGVRLPLPEFTPLSAPEPVLATLLAQRDHRGGCVMMASPSAAVRLAALARSRGASLRGVVFIAGGEPLTPGKAAEIRGAGAQIGSLYGFTEGGPGAVPCGDPQAPDDMHFLTCDLALILHRRPVVEVGELDSLMLTSLSTVHPKIMLNVEIDDFAMVETRHCGCPLDELGLHQHLTYLRSFTKLTGEGSTILGTDCVRILEEVLPREFGGRSIDYQLLEVEDEHHLTRLFLLVSPEVGPVDERRVLDRFIAEVRARTSQGLRMWRQAETVQVIRRHPVATPRGKILPFHTQALAAFLGPGAPGAAGLLPARPIGESAGVRAGPIT